MKLSIYMLYDMKSGSYSNIHFGNNLLEATRFYSYLAKNDPFIKEFVGDYGIYSLGSFDTVTGDITPEKACVANLIDVIGADNGNL